MKTINYKGKGEHSVRELELIIEQQAEELHLLKSGQKQLPIHGVSKRFSIEQAQELFFAGYFHYPMKELDKKETEVGGLNKEFLKVVERGNY